MTDFQARNLIKIYIGEEEEHYETPVMTPRTILEQAYDYLAPVYVRKVTNATTGETFEQFTPAWVRGQWDMDAVAHREAYGDHVVDLPVAKEVHLVCSMGAMLLATQILHVYKYAGFDEVTGYPGQDPNFAQALRMLIAAIDEYEPSWFRNRGGNPLEAGISDLTDMVIGWNDDPSRNQQQVLDVFQIAIKAAVKEESGG